MDNFVLCAQASRCCEQLKIIDDINDLGSHELKALDAMSSLGFTTRNSTFWHNFFGHEYNFVSKDDFGRQNLIFFTKIVSKNLIECEIRQNYL